PLSLRTEHGAGLVRTILAVDEAEASMTFAGDVPEGAYVRLMKANFDRLIDGAVGAARASHERLGAAPVDLAILISCVGRKLVLHQRIEEEVEGVREVLGERATLTGFYSYGEISPFTPTARCELHNQTMTVTTFSER
ncbi:MAG: FIST C-terminal domain-containing protein, partial [Candidatus Rokubacteria bacterium]|nr:FIST C-terminal domain-containing protein [Candidatus Rokubacteria bacterium]